jgi:hypothetical protein
MTEVSKLKQDRNETTRANMGDWCCHRIDTDNEHCSCKRNIGKNQEDRGVWDCADIPGIVVWGPEGSGQWGLCCILYQVGQAGTIKIPYLQHVGQSSKKQNG